MGGFLVSGLKWTVDLESVGAIFVGLSSRGKTLKYQLLCPDIIHLETLLQVDCE